MLLPLLGLFRPHILRRALLYLQLIMQIQAKLAEANSSTNILKRPEHILMFVKHALEDIRMSGRPQTTTLMQKRTGLGLGDLKIIQDSDSEDELGSDDSDNEDEGSANAVPCEIIVTTLNLLLALLEGNLFRLRSNLPYS
jgi:hypothetical protein